MGRAQRIKSFSNRDGSIDEIRGTSRFIAVVLGGATATFALMFCIFFFAIGWKLDAVLLVVLLVAYSTAAALWFLHESRTYGRNLR